MHNGKKVTINGHVCKHCNFVVADLLIARQFIFDCGKVKFLTLDELNRELVKKNENEFDNYLLRYFTREEILNHRLESLHCKKLLAELAKS